MHCEPEQDAEMQEYYERRWEDYKNVTFGRNQEQRRGEERTWIVSREEGGDEVT